MTQKEQVIDALRKIGKKATFKEIYKKIDVSRWGKTPDASIRMYLTDKKSPIKREKDNNKTYYILDESIKNVDNTRNANDNKPLPKNKDDKNIGKNNKNGIYFICLSNAVSFPAAESLFKIGSTEDITNRMNSYSSSLPYDPVQLIDFFPVPIGIKLKEIEDELRKTLLSSNDLRINKYTGGKHKEWLQKPSCDMTDKNRRGQLVSKIRDIFNDIIKKKCT
jgi:T5orf172 domain.